MVGAIVGQYWIDLWAPSIQGYQLDLSVRDTVGTEVLIGIRRSA